MTLAASHYLQLSCNILTFILPLIEGQTGKAWDPSNEIFFVLSPAQNKVSLISTMTSLLRLLFYYPFLSLRFLHSKKH
jgi:hypothetical protein